MKITRLYLKNVIQIYNGGDSGLKKIDVDFNEDMLLTLIRGEVGSGKSGFLQSCTPFNVEVYRPDHKGMKIIEYDHNNNHYVITHVAVPTKTGHSIKSYITKNGEELNENGTVNSFLKNVEEELDIDPAKISFTYITNDMQSIVSMTSTSRRNYVSKFIYMSKEFDQINKKVNADISTLNKLIATTRIVGVNKDDLEEQIKDFNKKKLEVEEQLKSFQSESAIKKHELDLLSNKLNEMKDKIPDYKALLKNVNNPEFKEFMKMSQDELESTIKSNNNLINSKKELLELKINIKKEKEESISNLEDKLTDIDIKKRENKFKDKNTDENILNDIIKTSKYNINKYEDIYYQNKALCGKEQNILYLLQCIRLYKQNTETYLDQMTTIITDYNQDFVGNNIQLNKMYENITAEKIKCETLINDIKYKIDNNLTVPDGCNNNKCPFISMYKSKDYYEAQKIELLNQLLEKEEILNNIKNEINNNLNIIEVKKEKEKLINILNQNYDILQEEFNINLLAPATIENLIVDLEQKLSIINILNLYEKSQKDKREAELELNELIIFKNFTNDEKIYQEKLNKELYDVKSLELEINNIELDIKKMEDNNNDLQNFLTLTDNKSIKEIDEYVETYNKGIEDEKRLIYENSFLEKNIQNTTSEKIYYENEINNRIHKIKQIEESNKQIEFYNSLLSEYQLIKDGTGNKKGIPSKYIKKFMAKIQSSANSILKRISGDQNIQFGEFIIEDNEFRIPLIGKGEGAPDVSKGSSGERAISSLALSLALYTVTNSEYNILTLDEVDCNLDSNMRINFANMIMEEAEILGIDQIIMISHNNCFDDIPSNLLLFKGAGNINTNGKEILYKFK